MQYNRTMCKVRSGTEGEYRGLPGKLNECFRGVTEAGLAVCTGFTGEVGWVKAQEEEDMTVDRVGTKAWYIEESVKLVRVELRERVDRVKSINLKR